MASWCTPEKGGNGTIIGEIFFGLHSFAPGTAEQLELNKLVDILKTFQFAEVHDFEKPSLLLLGDAEAAEGNTIAKSRAAAVEQYLRSKLPPTSLLNVKIEAAAKGGALLPGMKAPPGQHQRVCQI